MSHSTVRMPAAQEISAGERWLAALMTVGGFIAAAIGLWYAIGPDDGTINVLGWTWSIQAAPAWLAPLLLITGGVLMSSAMAVEAVLDGRASHRGVAVFETLLALVGVAALVFGIVILF